MRVGHHVWFELYSYDCTAKTARDDLLSFSTYGSKRLGS